MGRNQDLKYSYGDHKLWSARLLSGTKVVPRNLFSSLDIFSLGTIFYTTRKDLTP
jgi:hypothetical protein